MAKRAARPEAAITGTYAHEGMLSADDSIASAICSEVVEGSESKAIKSASCMRVIEITTDDTAL